jgi:hypothetical protein
VELAIPLSGNGTGATASRSTRDFEKRHLSILKRWMLGQRPDGEIPPSHLELAEEPIRKPANSNKPCFGMLHIYPQSPPRSVLP